MSVPENIKGHWGCQFEIRLTDSNDTNRTFSRKNKRMRARNTRALWPRTGKKENPKRIRNQPEEKKSALWMQQPSPLSGASRRRHDERQEMFWRCLEPVRLETDLPVQIPGGILTRRAATRPFFHSRTHRRWRAVSAPDWFSSTDTVTSCSDVVHWLRALTSRKSTRRVQTTSASVRVFNARDGLRVL